VKTEHSFNLSPLAKAVIYVPALMGVLNIELHIYGEWYFLSLLGDSTADIKAILEAVIVPILVLLFVRMISKLSAITVNDKGIWLPFGRVVLFRYAWRELSEIRSKQFLGFRYVELVALDGRKRLIHPATYESSARLVELMVSYSRQAGVLVNLSDEWGV
jgi:hypothetical protein